MSTALTESEIDALVETHVFTQPDWPDYHTVPTYTTDIAAAWLVVAYMLERGSDFCIERVKYRQGDRWFASFSYVDKQAPVVSGMDDNSIPMAICRAALSALGVEV